jgi:hypothetical protein
LWGAGTICFHIVKLLNWDLAKVGQALCLNVLIMNLGTYSKCAKFGTEMDHKYTYSFIICKKLLSHYEQGMRQICETVSDRNYANVNASTLK